MSKRKSEKVTEKLANGSAEEDNVEEDESRASKRVKASKDKASKKKESARNSRKRSSKSLKEEDEESDTEYEVLKIVDVKTDKKGKKQFLVNWKGYSNKDNSWEPEEHLSCDDLIEEFYAETKNKSPEKKKAKTPSKSGKKKKN